MRLRLIRPRLRWRAVQEFRVQRRAEDLRGQGAEDREKLDQYEPNRFRELVTTQIPRLLLELLAAKSGGLDFER
jgi:hypothetical protein